MYNEKSSTWTPFQITGVTFMSIILLGLLVTFGLWGCPQYNVYSARKEGEAQLAHAQSSKEVAVAEAKAKMESASYEAQADTIRAHGIAASNQIIGHSLENNPAYLQWLFIDQLKETKDQVIYVPSGNMGLPILEAGRGFDQKLGTHP
jgi:regulator of protease activity HflC (stomatin/prohibitin superfamily)